MKKSLTLLSFFMIVFQADAQIKFQKTFGGNATDVGYSVQQTTDGGYIIAGLTYSFGAGNSDVYLIKTDANGDAIWTRTFGGSSDEQAYSVQQTTDAGYIITGRTSSFGAGATDVYLIRTDVNGNLLWTKTFGGADNDWGNSVQQTNDGGFIILGVSSSFGASFQKVYLIKTDTIGNLIWTKTFGGTNDGGLSIQQTADGGYVLCGGSEFGAGNVDVYLIKTDANGDSLWTKTYGGTEDDYGNSVQQTTDGGYIIAGNTNSSNSGNGNLYLIKTDSSGDSLWVKSFDLFGLESGSSVKQTSDGGYIILGSEANLASYIYNVLLIKTDSNGSPLWTKTFGTANDDDGGYDVQQTIDRGFVIIGFTKSFTPGNADFYLIKTDSSGNSGCNDGSATSFTTFLTTQVSSSATMVTSPNTIASTPSALTGNGGSSQTLCTSVGLKDARIENEFVIIPNPTSSFFHICISAPHREQQIEIFNLLGEKIFSAADFQLPLPTIDCRLFPPGIYFVSLQSENGIATQKLIKQ
ncbi:MAG: T9SS type A sorting domain-containing protein [Bacteroidota bacterium]